MKILQIFGAVVAVHLLAFIFIFASPGCQSGPRNVPTPDATVTSARPAPISYNSGMADPQPVDLGTASRPAMVYTPINEPGHATPTRPGSPAAVAISPAKSVANVAPVSTYTVARGDSLWSIANKNHLTVSELAKANNIGVGTVLQPGKKLIIPGGKPPAATQEYAAPSAPMKAAAPAHATGEAVKHTVQAGETLGVIARKYQVTTGELAAANNITDPSKVRAGQELVIPGFKAVSSKSAPTTAASRAAAKPAAADTPAADVPATPSFQITAPPPGQDLDSGLKAADTEVPTIRVEDAPPPKK